MKPHIIAIIMACLVSGCASPAAQCSNQVNTFMAKASPIYSKFKDTTDLASSTARIGLAPVIQSLQAARREWNAIEPPACGKPGASLVDAGMGEFVDGYIAFMAQKDDLTVLGFMSAGKTKTEDGLAQLKALQLGETVTPTPRIRAP